MAQVQLLRKELGIKEEIVITIRLQNLRSYVSGLRPEQTEVLDSALRVRDNKAWFKGPSAPTHINLFDIGTSSFPTGLLPEVRGFLREEFDLDSSIEDTRKRLPGPSYERLETFGQTLAEHQIGALKALERSTRGIVKSPTSSGKGTIISAICHAWHQCRWLVLVHRAQIAKELGERFTRLTGEPHGFVGQGRGDVEARVVFGTFQSFYSQRRKRACIAYLASVDGLIVDECHVASAPTWNFITMSTPNAFWRCGTSGTPVDRGDGRNMVGVGGLGPIIHKVENDELEGKGFVAHTTVVIVPHRQEIDVKDATPLLQDIEVTEENARDILGELEFSEDPKAIYSAAIAFSESRNKVVLQLVQHAQKHDRLPALVFVKLLDHGKLLTKRLERLGFRVAFVSGRMPVEQRESAIRSLGDTLDIVVGNVVLQEGIDQERIVSVVNSAGGRSTIQALQQAGRARRIGRQTDKTECFIYEIEDFGHRWIERHAKARIYAYKKSGYDIHRLPLSDLPKITV